MSGQLDFLELPYHQAILNDEIPLSIGGGIGQARTYMYLLRTAHLGEVTVTVWPEELKEICAEQQHPRSRVEDARVAGRGKARWMRGFSNRGAIRGAEPADGWSLRFCGGCASVLSSRALGVMQDSRPPFARMTEFLNDGKQSQDPGRKPRRHDDEDRRLRGGGARLRGVAIEHPREEIDALCPPEKPLEYACQLDYRKDADRASARGGRADRGAVRRRRRAGRPVALDPERHLRRQRAAAGGRTDRVPGAARLQPRSAARGRASRRTSAGGRSSSIRSPSTSSNPLARYSGHRDIERKSLGHALNTKATARKAAKRLGRPLADVNLIIAHLGSGISIAPLREGRMVDVNNAASGGPFSPERAGGLPLIEMLDYMKRRERTR